MEGVLGGFGRLSGIDIKASQTFLEKLKDRVPFGSSRALDCGAGIGRVTKDLLRMKFDSVDLVEPCDKLLLKAVEDLPNHRGGFYLSGLQSFDPLSPSSCIAGKEEVVHLYDCIWAQWVLLYLTGDDLVAFFKRCAAALKDENSVICFKENVVLQGDSVLDEDDCSLTRNVDEYRQAAHAAGLKVVLEMRQSLWPSNCFPVVMFACQRV